MARYNSVNSTNSVGAGSTISSPFSGLLTTIPSAGTVTIPNPVLYAGTTQVFYNAAPSGNVTLTTPSGVFNGPGAGGTGSFTLPFGSIVTLVSDGTNYITQDWLGGTVSTTNLVATGGSINNTTIGGSTAAAGTFVALTASGGTITLTSSTTGSMDNVTIGGTTSAAGTFSSLKINTSTAGLSTPEYVFKNVSNITNGGQEANAASIFGKADAAGDISVFIGSDQGTNKHGYIGAVNRGTGYVPLLINPAGGSVGIGTKVALPTTKLEVVATDGTTGGIRLSHSSGVNGPLVNIYQSSSDGFIDLYTGDNPTTLRVRFTAYGNSYLNPAASGNFGIGNATPSVTLDMGSRTDAVSLPKGTTAQRPTGATGYFRFNTTFGTPEFFTGSAWSAIGLKDGSSFASAATSAVALYDLGIRGKGLFWITKADGTPIQVYCDLDTISPSDGKAGWMLVGSWATASEWTKDSTSSAATFGATALNCFSSSFGNTSMQHMRVKVSTAVDTAVTSSEADWYYYWNAAIQWKTVWAAGSGTNTHYNSNTGTNNGGVVSVSRNSLRQFTSAYNLRWSYASTQQIWNNLSDSGVSGTTGTEAWYDWYSGLTTAGVTLGVYNAGGAGRQDGTLAILPQGIAAADNTAGQDCNDNNAKYGWDDATIAAWAGTSATANLNANTGTQGANTNMWMWIK